MQCLTRAEAQERSANITLEAMEVDLDLTHAADTDSLTYPVTSALTLTTASPRVVVDVAGAVEEVRIDGVTVPFTHAEERLVVGGVPTGRRLTVEVVARCDYSRTGEGLHRYVDPEDGRVYLYTHFEPNDAHRAWPCLDQPDIKPSWTFHVTAPAEWVVTSNGPEESREEVGAGVVRHSFAPTPPLSAYISAVVAGQWHVVDGGTWRGRAGEEGPEVEVPLRVMCRTSLAQHLDAEDVLTVTRAGLDFFHAHYGITYPWGGYDQVFVPEYNIGAMENPGCVTFNEHFIHRSTPTRAQRQRRANTILHEMCHMWFGDLVTPAWWDDLWLKESFADNQGTTACALATEHRAEWASFAVARKAWAHEQDQYPTTHPIVADIPDVAAAKTNFDGITYAKGAAVLRQLQAWVGDEAFYAGARHYFRAHAFGATSLADLLSSLEHHFDGDLDAWQRAWLGSAGPNVLSAEVEAGKDGRITALRLRQEAGPHCTEPVRPHRLLVSTWGWRNGRLERTHSFDVRLEGTSAEVDTDRLLDHPGGAEEAAMVLVNDHDLTYALCRFTESSRRVALDGMGTIADVHSRAVVWANLWNEVRDGLLDPRAHLGALLRHAPTETEEAILARLLDQVRQAIGRFLPRAGRAGAWRRVAEVCLAVLADRVDAELAQRWAELLVDALAEGAAHTGALDEARAIAAARSELVEVGEELRWRALCALAACGEVSGEDIDEALREAPTGAAVIHHARARAALPDEEETATAWNAVRAEGTSNEMMSALLAGLARSSSTGWRREGLAELADFWEGHTIGMGLRFARGILPTHADIDPAEDAVGLDEVRAWLDAHEHAPAALRRVVLEAHDDLARSLTVQGAWEPRR